MFYTVMVKAGSTDWEVCYGHDGRNPYIVKSYSAAKAYCDKLTDANADSLIAMPVEYKVFKIGLV